jgi:hypothetical protein
MASHYAKTTSTVFINLIILEHFLDSPKFVPSHGQNKYEDGT